MLLLGGAALAAVLLVWIFTRLMAQPAYQALYTGLEPGDEQMLAQRLAARGVPFRVSADGKSLSVPASRIDKVRMEMAAQGLPHSGQMGWELFDKPNWMGSSFDDQVDYQRALEGELERSILTLANVEAARVNLVLSHQSLFTTQARPAKASVVVRLRSGGLTPQQVAGIQHLVAGAVDNLDAKDVTVINASDGLEMSAGPAAPFGAASGLQQRLQQQLIALLTPIAGPGQVRAQVAVEYRHSTVDTDSVTYDPKGQVLVASVKSSESATAPGAAGIPGATSNVPGPQPGGPAVPAVASKAKGAKSQGAAVRPAGYAAIAAVGANQGENRSSESDQYVVSHEVMHQVSPAGRIKDISAAILVNDIPVTRTVNGHAVTTYQPRPAAQMAQIRSLAMAAIGFNAQRGDQLTVANVRFDLPPAPAPAPPDLNQRVLAISQGYAPELRYAGLLILFLLAYLLLFRPLQKALAASLARHSGAPAPAAAALAGAGADRAALPRGAAAGIAAPGMTAQGMAEAIGDLHLPEPGHQIRRAEALKTQLMAVVKKEPEASSRLVRNWIRSETRS